MAKTTTQNGTKKAGKMTTKNHTPDKVLGQGKNLELAAKMVTRMVGRGDAIDVPAILEAQEKGEETTLVMDPQEAPKKTKEPQKFTILVHEIHEITFEAPTRRMAKKMAKDKTVLDHIQENTFFERTIVVKSLKHKQ